NSTGDSPIFHDVKKFNMYSEFINILKTNKSQRTRDIYIQMEELALKLGYSDIATLPMKVKKLLFASVDYTILDPNFYLKEDHFTVVDFWIFILQGVIIITQGQSKKKLEQGDSYF
ncbi:MAG: hypothetical protein MHPSP_002370, partial [Paramarteilia canceri]